MDDVTEPKITSNLLKLQTNEVLELTLKGHSNPELNYYNITWLSMDTSLAKVKSDPKTPDKCQVTSVGIPGTVTILVTLMDPETNTICFAETKLIYRRPDDIDSLEQSVVTQDVQAGPEYPSVTFEEPSIVA